MTDIMQRPSDDSPSGIWVEENDGATVRAVSFNELQTDALYDLMRNRWRVVHSVPGGELSTVFLGVCTWGDDLYETAFFPDDDSGVRILERYPTRKDAEEGHTRHLAERHNIKETP